MNPFAARRRQATGLIAAILCRIIGSERGESGSKLEDHSGGDAANVHFPVSYSKITYPRACPGLKP